MAALSASAVAPGCSRAETTGLFASLLDQAFGEAATLPQLRSMIVARDGAVVRERVFQGPNLDTPVNIKSASKSVLSALAGVAIGQGVLSGVDAQIAPLLGERVPQDADPRISEITIEDLLTMRAGLGSTSSRNYGPWVVSEDWVAYALEQPFVADPGGRMIYSTGSSHLLSTVLTRASGRSTLALARDWLGEPLGIEVPPWTRDPQGVYMGGNQMALSPRALLKIGELYRNNGVHDGVRVLPDSWVDESWRPRVRSPWSGGSYGYGWWLGQAGAIRLAYAWGYGGQMIYVAPSLGLTAIMTSDPDARGVDGHVQSLHRLVSRFLVPAAQRGES
ncbi:serine hydrolase [Parvularcula dongshanensis]|uniref:CubicO group peptidase (Beta-lactamase class C family) n=1 Tax=Parvularcula dongshanensis TaxID=1173995 RepID=A0A840I2S5_9PROT|nr:CubicO group peptidase (beta-lactamase class C family) [Parvularcula dongshanensis]